MSVRSYVIDQGNSQTKVGVFEDARLIANERFAKGEEDHLLAWIGKSHCAGGIVSSVRSDQGQALVEILGTGAYRMHQGVPLPFGVDYATPHTLGVDRLANAAGALHLCDTPNILIIDCGTCLTVTWMQNRRLQGGSISPGLRMRYQALSQLTGQLPLIEPTKDPIEPTGKSTEGSIRSGVQHGMLAEIKEIIEQYCSTNEPLSVIVTGGDASYFVPRLKSLIFAEPFLTLMGLHEIYQFRLTHL